METSKFPQPSTLQRPTFCYIYFRLYNFRLAHRLCERGLCYMYVHTIHKCMRQIGENWNGKNVYGTQCTLYVERVDTTGKAPFLCQNVRAFQLQLSAVTLYCVRHLLVYLETVFHILNIMLLPMKSGIVLIEEEKCSGCSLNVERWQMRWAFNLLPRIKVNCTSWINMCVRRKVLDSVLRDSEAR